MFSHNFSEIFRFHFAALVAQAVNHPQEHHPLASLLIVSASDGTARAHVLTVEFSQCWSKLTIEQVLPEFDAVMTRLQAKFGAPICWINLQWVLHCHAMQWRDLQRELTQYKRNYFRAGIAFPGGYQSWLPVTEMELNANACLYNGATSPVATVHVNHLTRYFKRRHGSSQLPDFSSDFTVQVFQTDGVFIDLTLDHPLGRLYPLDTTSRYQGHRRMASLTAPQVFELTDLASQYLGRQVQHTGQFVYGYFPCFGRQIETYNMLRHASSLYALLEGYENCRTVLDQVDMTTRQVYLNEQISTQRIDAVRLGTLAEQIDRALGYLMSEGIRQYDNGCSFVVDVGNQIKLGANAVAILALVKYLDVFPDSPRRMDYLMVLEGLARGILHMQNTDGSFVHVLNGQDLTVLEKNRIIYYDGEAAFGLMRLYGLTGDRRWLECVIRAFDFFIINHHEKAHDHWLAYCSNELIKYRPERKYFAFAVRNVQGYIDFIKNRITTFPTLLELSMAFHQTLIKLEDYPDYQEVLADFDVAGFYEALHTRARYLVNGFFFPEVAMYYQNPQQILHGFFIRHHAFRVRIDDVEHYLSGLIAYQRLLQKPQSLVTRGQSVIGDRLPPVMDARHVAMAMQGTWKVVPPDGWLATGLCCAPRSFAPGHMVVARGKGMDTGYLPPVAIRSLVRQGASAIITDHAESYSDYGVPVLQVHQVRTATLNLGRWVRNVFGGQVIGVTGSAGKTTMVAMLAHALGAVGKTEYSRGSANLPVGIAWNLACMAQDADYWIVEMAIGNMSLNSDIVRPQIAMITNIAAAHLVYHHTVDNIAIKKSRIFEKMAPGSHAVICRDIEQYALIAQLAQTYRLNIVSYGKHPDADIRLLDYQVSDSKFMLDGQVYRLSLPQSVGEHMVINALGVIAVSQLLGAELRVIIQALHGFRPVRGRGDVRPVQHDGISFCLYDEAYNANPLSMQAALAMFEQVKVPVSQKLLILGDMLELGDESQTYHIQLATQLVASPFRRIILVGEAVQATLTALQEQGITAQYFASTLALQPYLSQILHADDHVLIKASHGIGLQQLFERSKT